VLIVDDEAPARRRLRDLLDDCASALPLAIIGEAQHGREALELLQSAPADLVLTDIHMPDMDGVELARHLLKLPHPPVVIFTTAFHEHAVQAFELNAVDYLMKPIRVQRLLSALHKIPRLKPVTAEKLAQLPTTARRFLSVTERSRVVLVPVEDVVYLKAELKYITIRTSQREYLLEESLTRLETEFGARFVRVHRNCLAATTFAASSVASTTTATRIGKSCWPACRRRCRCRGASNSSCATWGARPPPDVVPAPEGARLPYRRQVRSPVAAPDRLHFPASPL
jgi:two-component system response regulator AlgR